MFDRQDNYNNELKTKKTGEIEYYYKKWRLGWQKSMKPENVEGNMLSKDRIRKLKIKLF